VGSMESPDAASGGFVTERKKIVLSIKDVPQTVTINGSTFRTTNPQLIAMSDLDARNEDKRRRLIRQIRIQQAEENGELLLCDADFD
jgi:hypothetical protein